MWTFDLHKVRVVVAVLIVIWPVLGQAKPRDYARAEAAFDNFSVEGKATLQVMLTSAGYWSQIPRTSFSRRLFEDIGRFQADLGHRPTGYLTSAQIDSLIALAVPHLRFWGFVAMPHPTRGRPIWVPRGVGGKIVRSKFGFEFAGEGVTITYNYYPDTMLEPAFHFMVDKLGNEGQTILYQVLRRDFYAISTAKDAVSKYFRYHRDGSGLLGFTMVWETDKVPLHGERISTLVSSSLSNQMLGTPMIPLPSFEIPRDAARPHDEAARDRPPRSPPETSVSSGSGFFIGARGDLVTNHHVVEGCSDIRVFAGSQAGVAARLRARDRTNDLALLGTGLHPPRAAALRADLRLGERIAAFGYPHADLLASSGNFTLGNVTALAGIGDDSRYIQISAPVQSGNSGGPLLDRHGNLVGVVTSKLDAMKIAQTSGDLPQNINFALKASILASFLEVNGIDYAQAAATSPLKDEDLADEAKAISVFVRCK